VFKAVEEYKDEHSIEINSSVAEEAQAEESGELSNPNEELPVTFLFYELQRRYRIAERIHRLTPVVLVAHEVPAPHEVDEDWLVTHDWIIRRAILDDSFLPALTYVGARIVGDERALEELARNVELQRTLVDDLKDELGQARSAASRRYAALQEAFEKRAESLESDDGGWFGGLTETLTGVDLVDKATSFFGSDDSADAARLREEAARDAYERATRAEQETRGRVDRAVSALNDLTETYTKQLSEHLNRKAQIARLRVHVKQNILHYMQAIWTHEPPDQRYFRLHQVRVPVFNVKAKTYTIGPVNERRSFSGSKALGVPNYPVQVDVEMDPELRFQTLAEAADLDTLLGFKGNYLIFPLRESNALTDFMMTPWVDTALDLQDPDDAGNGTAEEFAEYVCCLKQTLEPTRFEELRPVLREEFKRILSNPRRNGEEIAVPTGSLYIEALPGAHPILEDFKLMHRAMDVKKVLADVRRSELDNVRMAARMLNADYEDPNVDSVKRVYVSGTHPNLDLDGDE
jgi:hypothetical protein